MFDSEGVTPAIRTTGRWRLDLKITKLRERLTGWFINAL